MLTYDSVCIIQLMLLLNSINDIFYRVSEPATNFGKLECFC